MAYTKEQRSGASGKPRVSCRKHGPSAFCFVQDDGAHIDPIECRCGLLLSSPRCPIDAHRAQALNRKD